MHRFTFYMRKEVVRAHSFYVAIQTPVMCDEFAWNRMCDISYGIIFGVSVKVLLEWILFNSWLIHSLDPVLFSSGCACFSVSHDSWAKHLLRKKHQNNYSVYICCQIMCCIKSLLVNCIVRHESILHWHTGRCKEESIQNCRYWKNKIYYFNVSLFC